MKFIVGMVIINWKVWFVPDLDFEKLEGMPLMLCRLYIHCRQGGGGVNRVTCHPLLLILMIFIIFIWVDIGISNKKITNSQ